MTASPSDRHEPADARSGRDPGRGDGMPTLESLVAWARDHVRFDGRYGLSLRAERRGSLFASLRTERETFFRDGQGVAGFPIEHNPDLPDFLDGRSRQPFAYGYPVHVDAAGLVTPLFFVEVTVGLTLDSAQVRKVPNHRPRLSRRLLIESGHDPAMADATCRAIEHGSFPSLEACLEELAGYLDVRDATLADIAAEPFPAGPPAPGWYRTPILFVSPVSPLQKAQLGELQRLLGAYTAATHMTALHALVSRRADQPGDGGSGKTDRLPMLEIEPLSEAASASLDRCLSAGLSAVEAPPGGEREAFIADAIANLVVSGQSVLYVHPGAEMTDEVVDRFQGLLARRQCWIPRLGGEDMLERLSRTADELETQRPTGIAPPSKQARQRALSELKGDLATARGRIDSARNAIRALADCRAERRDLQSAVPVPWQPVFDYAEKLGIGAETASAAAAELRSMTRERPGLFGRLFGRNESEARIRAMAGTAADAVSALPDAIRGGLPLPESDAAGEPSTTQSLAEAFQQLERIARWRDLRAREAERLAEVRQLPPADRIGEQLTQAESRLARDSQGLLRDVWRAAVAKGAAKSGEKLAAVFQAITDRRFSWESATEPGHDPAGDPQLAKFMRLLVRNYPFWAVPADLVPTHLPLIDGLFDMAIIDDSGTMTAGALLPLLLRVRHAMVLAPVDRDRQPVNSGFSLAAAAETAEAVALSGRMRQHPEIVGYLSAVFHNGGLSLLGAAPGSVPVPDRTVSGLMWHQPDGEGVEAEARAVLALLETWEGEGLFAGDAPLTIGIAIPVAARLAALEEGVLAALPDGLSEEAVLFGPPAQFKDLALDVMILVPGLESGMTARAAAALAWNRELFHDAAAAAERGLHCISDEEACLAAGGFAAALARHCRQRTDGNEAEGLIRLCGQAGLSHRAIAGGLEVVGRFGGLYQFIKEPGQSRDNAEEEAGAGLNAEIFSLYLNREDFSEPPQWLAQLFERLC